MKNLTASEIERLKGYNPTRYQTYLIKMNINGNMLYLTDRDAPVFYGGVYYQPGYITSDSIDDIEVTSEPATNEFNTTLDARDGAFIPYFLNKGWNNSEVTVYEQHADELGVIVTLNVFEGFIDSRDIFKETRKIDAVLASVWADFEKQAGTKTNSGSHQKYYPDDTAFEHVARAKRKIYWGKNAPVASSSGSSSGSGRFDLPRITQQV
ncbi:DUF2163 domain-containing protein [Alteromonas sp. BL110]|uniref:DUF2163 domain-containing protein n=1 Tax=Alteromonas portus TaxID=2565549 RepID=A0A4U0ZHD2_9ALTE|nr:MULTISPECIES: DUF2163 domain-containing protein [Alteromonas]AXT40266.1 DUF2163 domain-containing protein [Alteromonas sp. BL110]RKM79498.1 DUF2163 domain-containing protein [Alteromonas sp. BL110]TKB03906.1 DUF2163 domain-containing protein [Alteromonas portus]